MKILRGGRRKGKLGLLLGTGKASGGWTAFLRQLPGSKQARAESCDQHGRKSIKSIDKTANSVVAFYSINYGVCPVLD